MTHSIRSLSPFLSGLLLLAGLTAQKPLPAERSQGASAVTVEQAKKWLHHLAGPELAGRGTGQPGFRLAADYVRDHFQALGLEPGVNGSWFQDMPWTMREPKLDATSLTFELDGKKSVVPGARLQGTANMSLSAEGEVVLLVWSESTDLEDVAVEGKVVVVALPEVEKTERDPKGRIGAMRRQFQILRTLQGSPCGLAASV